MGDWHPCVPGHIFDSGGLCGRCGLLDRDKATDPRAEYSILRKSDHAALIADVRKLDAVVHALSIEDSHEEPAAKIAALQAELEEATLARGRLRLWLEFIHLNSNDAKEFTAEALTGNAVPKGFVA